MLKINLKLALRNILRNKLYTAINIIGLGVASAFCILVYLYVKNEQSFDNFHKDGNRLFRVEQSDFQFGPAENSKPAYNFFSFLMKDAEVKHMLETPLVLSGDLKSNFPEIENTVRINPVDGIVTVNNNSFKEAGQNIAYVDADFLKIFNYPLLIGNAHTALSSRNQVILSKRLAKKYFGNADPVGKPLSFDKTLFTVGGVVKDFPVNSSFQYDLLIPREAGPDYFKEMGRGVNSFSDYLIIKLKPGVDKKLFAAKLYKFGIRYYQPFVDIMKKNLPDAKFSSIGLYIRPFSQSHYNQSEGWSHYTDLKNIYQLVCITILILFIACLNYVLLTLTNAIYRSQDVGIRKAIGAKRKQIVFQYYVQTQLLAFISVAVGFFIAILCLPFFSALVGSSINLNYFSMWGIITMLFVLGIVLGLLAGIYPAYAMSGLKPLSIVRGFSIYRINPFLSKGLVVLQYSICIILIISTLIINKQIHFVSTTDMGFDKDQVVEIENPYAWPDVQKAKALRDKLANYVSSEPAIQDFTSTTFNFGGYNTKGFFINGQNVTVEDLNVDYNYFSFSKIALVKGRSFERSIAADSAVLKLPDLEKSTKGSLARQAIVVNQSLYSLLGKPELGILNEQMGGVIIGVSKDYHTQDLTQKIMPAYHAINPDRIGYYWFKIRAGQSIPVAMDKIKANWDKLTNNMPFSYTFMDQDVAKSYDAYKRWMSTITTSCILAILIACLGLFGLSGLTTLNRTKEIGIRKVLGASVSNLFVLLNRGTLYLAAGSFVIAAPIAFYLVQQWLDNFAYRIKPNWLLFTSAGAIAMLTAIIAVSYHTIRAAVANPVNSLRNE